MKISGKQITTFALVAVIVAGVGYLAWTQRPGGNGGNASSVGDLASLEPGMLDSHAPSPGEPAPDFILTDADGNKLRLSDLRGTPVFLNFWATWCAFCIQEMPDMERIQEQYGENLVVLGVNNGESVSVGEPYARNRVDVSYQLLYDPDQGVVAGYNVRAMPTSYFIDAEGVIREFQFGFLTLEQMQEKVEAAMTGAPAS